MDKWWKITTKGKKRKCSRKSLWQETVVNDMINIILENKTFKREILLENNNKKRNVACIGMVIQELKDRNTDEEIT